MALSLEVQAREKAATQARQLAQVSEAMCTFKEGGSALAQENTKLIAELLATADVVTGLRERVPALEQRAATAEENLGQLQDELKGASARLGAATRRLVELEGSRERGTPQGVIPRLKAELKARGAALEAAQRGEATARRGHEEAKRALETEGTAHRETEARLRAQLSGAEEALHQAQGEAERVSKGRESLLRQIAQAEQEKVALLEEATATRYAVQQAEQRASAAEEQAQREAEGEMTALRSRVTQLEGLIECERKANVQESAQRDEIMQKQALQIYQLEAALRVDSGADIRSLMSRLQEAQKAITTDHSEAQRAIQRAREARGESGAL